MIEALSPVLASTVVDPYQCFSLRLLMRLLLPLIPLSLLGVPGDLLWFDFFFIPEFFANLSELYFR